MARGARRIRLALLASLATFVIVLTALSWVRMLELTTSTWDLGIYQQAIWSAAHGGPFYESADWETGGFGSFLQVHSAFVLYAVAPVYALLPSPVTLFAIQASVVALAALPLYALVRDLGGSPRRGLAAVAMYLMSAAILGSTLYDFHIEAFLPVEILTLVLFWHRRRYLLGSLVALLSFFTMEAAPLLAVSVAFYFLVGELLPSNAPSASPTSPPLGVRLRSLLGRCLRPHALASLGLLLVAGAAYFVLLLLRLHYLADFAGFPPFPTGENGYVIGATPGALGLSVSGLGVGFYQKLVYWITIFALVLFLPFRAPRSLLIPLPWILFTFLSSDTNYAELGFQYGFLVAAGVFPGVAFGLARLQGNVFGTPAGAPPRPSAEYRRRLRRRVPAVLLVLVLAANLLASPLDPMLQGSGPGSAYYLTYQLTPGYGDASRIAQLVPGGATVLASDVLFPLVANNLHAYTLFWGPNAGLDLPFSATDPPPYVLLAESRLGAVPFWLGYELYHPETFGIRALAWATPVGAVFLFQRGYAGPITELGPTPARTAVVSPAAVLLTTGSWVVGEPGTPFGAAVESVPYASGQLWTAAGWDLPPGAYDFTFWVKGWATDPQHPPDPLAPVLQLEGNPFSQGGWFDQQFTYGEVAHPAFEPITIRMNVTAPVMFVALRGYAITYAAGLGLAEIEIAPAPLSG